MITARNLKVPMGVRECTALYIFHPGTIYAKRNLIFRLARNRAGMTAYTCTIINDKSVIHINSSSLAK